MINWWHAPIIWPGNTAYIVGGGPSLEGFDWDLLKDKRVIGCNDAYLLGEDIVDVCCFGDWQWWNEYHKEGFKKYGGLKVTCCVELVGNEEDKNIHVMRREPRGVWNIPGKVGWNGHTGAMAINLAAIFGASKIVLLGFDMKLKEGKSNWHENSKDLPNADVFKQFIGTSGIVGTGMKKVFPNVEVLNANPDSAWNLFPKVELKEVL